MNGVVAGYIGRAAVKVMSMGWFRVDLYRSSINYIRSVEVIKIHKNSAWTVCV